MPESLYIALAPDELGETSSGRTLQARPQRPEAGDFVNLTSAQMMIPLVWRLCLAWPSESVWEFSVPLP